jgi:hypothetical protein
MGGGVTCGDGLPNGLTGNEQRGPNKYELEFIIWIVFVIVIVVIERCL